MEGNTNFFSAPLQSGLVARIESLGGIYDPKSPLPIDDQLFICELLAEENIFSSPTQNNNSYENKSANAKWSDNGTYKRSANTSLIESKQKAIYELKTFTYRTPPIKIAELLQTLFADCNSRDGHWLYVAQTWNLRAINRVIERITRLHSSGWKTIQNPAAYFTHLIKFRKKRKTGRYQ